MDYGYTSLDQRQWQREASDGAEIAILGREVELLRSSQGMLFKLCEICAADQIAKVEGLAELLATTKKNAEDEIERQEFMANGMSDFLQEEFAKLRQTVK